MKAQNLAPLSITTNRNEYSAEAQQATPTAVLHGISQNRATSWRSQDGNYDPNFETSIVSIGSHCKSDQFIFDRSLSAMSSTQKQSPAILIPFASMRPLRQRFLYHSTDGCQGGTMLKWYRPISHENIFRRIFSSRSFQSILGAGNKAMLM